MSNVTTIPVAPIDLGAVATSSLPYTFPLGIIQVRNIGQFPTLNVSGASHDNTTNFELKWDSIYLGPPSITILDVFTPLGDHIPNGAGIAIDVTVLVAAPGTYTTNLTVYSNDPGSPFVAAISVTVGTSGIQINVNPLTWDFGAILVGDATPEKLFRVTSVGTNPATVTAPTFATDFVAGSTVPSYSVTIPFVPPMEFIGGGAIDFIASGGIDFISLTVDFFDFGIVFQPTTGFLLVEDVLVNSDADNDPVTLTLTGYGNPIDPVYPVVDTEHLLIATKPPPSIANPSGNPTVLKADETNLSCERIATVNKQHNFNLPGVPKTTYAAYIHYEDLGEATLGVSLASETDNITSGGEIGTVGADGRTKTLKVVPIEVEDEIISFGLGVDGSGGPISITDYIIRHEPFHIRKGESPYPTITPYASLSEPSVLSLMVFVSDADDAVVAEDSARLVACGLPAISCCPEPLDINLRDFLLTVEG